MQYKDSVIIRPSGPNATWLEARELVRERGGLPSSAQFDDALAGGDAKQQLSGNLWWTRNVLVILSTGRHMAKGYDISDHSEAGMGRIWVLPASCVPEEALCSRNYGIILDPQQITITSSMVVIEADAQHIKVIQNLVSDSLHAYAFDVYLTKGMQGRAADLQACMPTEEGQAIIRPIARIATPVKAPGPSPGISACYYADSKFGVSCPEPHASRGSNALERLRRSIRYD